MIRICICSPKKFSCRLENQLIAGKNCSKLYFGFNDIDGYVIRKDSWKNREVEKFQHGPFEMKLQRMKLETSSRSWKVTIAMGKFWIKLVRSIKVGKSDWSKKGRLKLENRFWTFQVQWNFTSSLTTFQFPLQQNCPIAVQVGKKIPTSMSTFQLGRKLFNFWIFPTTLPDYM